MKDNNIVFVGFLTGYGGAEKSMINVANGLVEMGKKVTVISLKDDNNVYKMNEKVKYIYIPDHGSNGISRKINRFVDLKNALIKVKPELTISFWVQPAIYAAILSKFIGFKNIYSERGDPSDKEYSGKLKILRDVFFKFVDGFVFQTEGAKNCFSEDIQKRCAVINNPVYLKYDAFDIPKERKKIIVNVGRLHPQKNQMILIKAFKKIADEFTDYNLEIFGEGELKETLEKEILRLDLNKRVILRGTTKELYKEIVNDSLFVLSSDYEGMPNALMEAMALGLPCISTDCRPGGARELISNNENGIIANLNDADDLAEKMRYMLCNSDKAEKMAKEAKNICNSHSEEKIYSLWNKYVETF